MCGIAGIFGPGETGERLTAMVDALRSRGPDDRGIWTDHGVGLGHTRLSIIDLTDAGHQPMSYAAERYRIVYNGEIYNYRELRVELESSGMRFRTDSDTEVVLAAFAHWGPGCLDRLRGMFAFALWDSLDERLHLVRDRLGIKPLLWSEFADGVVFASELKGVLASGLVDRTMDVEALFDLLAIGSVCQPRTAIRGIHMLEPGMHAAFQIGKAPKLRRYWDPISSSAILRQQLRSLDYADAIALVRQRLEEACRYHLVADVPVGSFLSGGIDSTAVTALMCRQSGRPVKSFSLGFEPTPEVEHELEEASRAAREIGTEHHSVMLRDQEVAAEFDNLVRALDQPSLDGTNTYFVSRAAHEHVKVVLSGLGGDELFGGYRHFEILRDAECRPRWYDRPASALHRVRPNRFTAVSTLRRQEVAERYASIRRILTDRAIRSSVSPRLRRRLSNGFLSAYLRPLIDHDLDSVTQTSVVECRNYLLNTLLRDSDATSMAHSLEVRPIMLDHVLVEHALALRPDAKLRHQRRKAVLIDAMRDVLPASVINGTKKGFELPRTTWLAGVLRDRVRSCLEDSWALSVFDPTLLRTLGAPNQKSSRTSLLWTILMTVSWAREQRCAPPNV